MNRLRAPFYLLVAAALGYAAWYSYGGKGVAIFLTGLVTWVMLYITRMIHVMKRAAERPKGWVASAVMLNAKLKPGVNLLHVMAMTHSLGDALTEPDAQPELFRWTDDSGSHVTCEFSDGKLARWTLVRPPEEAPAEGPVPAP